MNVTFYNIRKIKLKVWNALAKMFSNERQKLIKRLRINKHSKFTNLLVNLTIWWFFYSLITSAWFAKLSTFITDLQKKLSIKYPSGKFERNPP
jgi:membrane protein insertase Oxa1/YidC/SpoIIIJ